MKHWQFIALIGLASALNCQPQAWAQTFFKYHCRDGAEFVVAFFEGDQVAHLQLDGKAIGLPKRASIAGSRYKKGDITLKITKSLTTLQRGNRLTECQAD